MQPTDKNNEFDLFQKTLRYIKAKKQIYTGYETSITMNHTFDCIMTRTLQFTFHYMYMVECTHLRKTPFSILSNIRKFYTYSEDVYDPDRDFVPLFDFSAPLTGFGDDFEDEDGEKHALITTCNLQLGPVPENFGVNIAIFGCNFRTPDKLKT